MTVGDESWKVGGVIRNLMCFVFLEELGLVIIYAE